MSWEYYKSIYNQKMAEYDALEKQLEANIAANVSVGGDAAADSDNMQALANIHAARQALQSYAQEQVARNTPRPQPRQTREQWEAKPPGQMTALDGLYIAQKGTRFEGQVRGDDPNVQAAYRRLWQEKQGR